jgi:hypothetical protein
MSNSLQSPDKPVLKLNRSSVPENLLRVFGEYICQTCGLFQMESKNMQFGPQCSCPDNTWIEIAAELKRKEQKAEDEYRRWVTAVPEKPAEYADALSEYGPVLFDSWCGEPVAWGFNITRHLGEDRWSGLGKYGKPECSGAGVWCLVTRWVTPREAIAKYGALGETETGPRGGFRSAQYGSKTFVCHRLNFFRPWTPDPWSTGREE